MNTAFWTPYISDGTMKAIGWTLIHSLWIGMIIALLAGIIISLTRKSAAVLRYRLLCVVLVSFVMAIGITWYMEARSNAPIPAATGAAKVFISIYKASPSPQVAAIQNQSIIDRTSELLNQNMSIIFMVWLLFLVLKSLKMVSGLLYIQRIRNYKTHPVTEELKHRIEFFSRQIGIRRAVSLVQSELVKVPVAVGWLKPMILLPVGIIFQLTPEQLDGILWHELAHIRRRDYLVNILQGLVETVFFFNPGLLWLSSLIRAEREACCDDMVLSRMSCKSNYMEALLAFGYGDFKPVGWAMGAGSGSQLRDRLRRMVNQENKRLNMAEKAILSAGLILLMAFTRIPKAGQVAGKLAGNVSKTISVMMKTPEGVKPAGPKVPLTETRPLLKPELVAKKEIVETADTVIHFKSVLFKNSDADLANNDVSAMDDQGNEYHFILVNNKITAMQINGVTVADDKLADFTYMIRYIDREIASKRHVMEGDIVAYKVKWPVVKFKMKDSLAYGKKKYTADADAKRSNMGQFGDEPHPYDLDMDVEPDARYFKSKDGLVRKRQDDANYGLQQRRANDVIAALVKEKVVANAGAVKWFGLSDSELIVNGTKQPEALHQKLKAAYGIRENYGLYYGPVEMTGTGVFIDDSRRSADGDNAPRFKADVQRMKFKKAKLNFQDQKMNMPGVQQLKAKIGFRPLAGLGPVISNVIDDLVKENILKDKNDLVSFNLTNTFLMVNGKKQPEAIQKRLSAKYLKNLPDDGQPSNQNDPNFGLHYDVKTGSRGMGISTDKLDP